MNQACGPTQDPTEPDREALLGAVEAVRRLISHLRKTQAPQALLASVAKEAGALADQLEGYDHPGPYAQRRLVLNFENTPRDTDIPAEFFLYSPAIGPLNPIAPPVEFHREGQAIIAEHTFDAPYNGPPTAVHGGVIALVFDELLGCAGAMLDTAGFTGTLTIRYEALTPLGRPIRMRGWVDGYEGRKVFIRGTMHDGETLCSEAHGTFIRPRKSIFEDAIAKSEAR